MGYRSLSFGIATLMALSLASTSAHAMGAAPVSTGGTSTSTNSTLSSIETLALDIAIVYAESNPQIGPVLSSLGIVDANSLQTFLNGNASGQNLAGILSYLVYNYAGSNSNVSGILSQLGITNYAQLQQFLLNPNSLVNQNTLLTLAYEYAASNPNYSAWLSALGVTNATGFANLLNGGSASNLQSELINIGLEYLLYKVSMSNTAASAATAIQLGAYQGLSPAQILAIRQATGAK